MSKLKVGVFDSGVGGLSVVNAIKKEFPDIEIIFKNDSEHVPYGSRTIEEIYGFTKPILESLVSDDCAVIVVACNTVTTNLISKLRSEISIPLVGMEPMVKPAAENTKTGAIAVCATPLTLTSDRYDWLKKNFADGVRVLEPDCSDWSLLIESKNMDRQTIVQMVDSVCSAGADQIVLGCTHYHWIEELIKEVAAGRAEVIQPEKPVVDQLRRVISTLK